MVALLDGGARKELDIRSWGGGLSSGVRREDPKGMVALIDTEDEVEEPSMVISKGDLGWLLSQGCGSRGEIGNSY